MVTDDHDPDRAGPHPPERRALRTRRTTAIIAASILAAIVLGLLYGEIVLPRLRYDRERAAFAARADSMSTGELLDLLRAGFTFDRPSADDFEYCVDLVLRNGGLTRFSMEEIRRRLGLGQVYAACLDPRIESDGLWITKVLVPRGTGVQYSVRDPHTYEEILMSLVFQDQTLVWAYYHRSDDSQPAPGGTLFEYVDGDCRITKGF